MTEPTKHARLSPSGASRWMTCPGSVALEAGVPEFDTAYADEGTAAHELAKWCLTEDKDAVAYLGRVIEVHGYDKGERVLREFEVDEEFAGHVQEYVDTVREYAGTHQLLVEQRLPIGHLTGEDGAEGTGDAIILMDDEIVVIDLKFGRGVRVDAQDNKQLKLYALGALEQYGLLGDFKRVRLVVHQPRLEHLSEWDCTVEHLQAFAREVSDASQLVEIAAQAWGQIGNQASQHYADWSETYLKPSDHGCQFCKAEATCPKLAAKVQQDVGADFEDLSGDYVDVKDAAKQLLETTTLGPADLARKMQAIGLIEGWCKAVRAEVERNLLAGAPVPGYKLVQGKRGNRKFADETVVTEMLRKQFRMTIEEVYNLDLKSPTQLEQVLKKEHPKQWEKLQAHITQSEGKPSVAPETDKRPALVITPPEDDFADLESAESLA